MNTEIHARFSTKEMLEKAERRLRNQGVIDIAGAASEEFSEELSAPLSSVQKKPHSERPSYQISVYVERSRYKQAEQTIRECGGII